MTALASFLQAALGYGEGLILFYWSLVSTGYVVLGVLAACECLEHRRRTSNEDRSAWMSAPDAPRISVIAPAFNEADTIEASVRALMSLDYPNLECVVVNDGSTDRTIDVLRAAFALVPVHPLIDRRLSATAVHGVYHSASYPHLLVVDKAQGGKSDALNVGIDLSAGALFCAIDSDTLVDSDALSRLVHPFIDNPDVIAVGGMLRVVNAAKVVGTTVTEARVSSRWLAGVQTVEYLRAFYLARLGWNRLGGDLIVSGAFGLFRTSAVTDAGGYAFDADGEDMELIVRLRRLGAEQRTPSRVQFVSDAVAWTEVPEQLLSLAAQRRRWHRGLAASLWTHARIIGRPRYGQAGMLAAPFYLLGELLAPIIELLGTVVLVVSMLFGLIDTRIASLVFVVAYGLGVVVSVAAILLEELAAGRHAQWQDRVRLVWWAVVEPFGFRQLTVVWRLQGLLQWMRGERAWGAMVRRAAVSQPTHAIVGLSVIAACIALAIPVDSAIAQTAAPMRVTVEASMSLDRLSNGRAPWQEQALDATVSSASRASVNLSISTLSRFDQRDGRIAVGGSLPLSARWTAGAELATSTTRRVLPSLSVEWWARRRVRNTWGIQATMLSRTYPIARVSRYALEFDEYVGPYRVAYSYGLSTLNGRAGGGAHRVVGSTLASNGSQFSLGATVGDEVELIGPVALQSLSIREADLQLRQRVHARWLLAATIGVEAHGALYTRAFTRVALRYQPALVSIARAH